MLDKHQATFFMTMDAMLHRDGHGRQERTQ
jgi:hypothetical protein